MVSFDSYNKLRIQHFKTKGSDEKGQTTLRNENYIQFVT